MSLTDQIAWLGFELKCQATPLRNIHTTVLLWTMIWLYVQLHMGSNCIEYLTETPSRLDGVLLLVADSAS